MSAYKFYHSNYYDNNVSLLGFRNSVERYFTANNRSLKLTKNPVFSRSNKMLESKLKAYVERVKSTHDTSQ